jgi:hypothetical protein
MSDYARSDSYLGQPTLVRGYRPGIDYLGRATRLIGPTRQRRLVTWIVTVPALIVALVDVVLG